MERRSDRRIRCLTALTLGLALFASGLGSGGAEARPAKVKPPLLFVGQTGPLSKDRVKVGVTGRARGKKGRVVGTARISMLIRTETGMRPAIEPVRLKIRNRRRTTRWAKLTAAGRNVPICSMKPSITRLKYRQRGAKKARTVRRKGRFGWCGGPPPPVPPEEPSRPASASCDPIDPSQCLLPWPNDHFAVDDAGSRTGQRLALSDEMLPKNADGKHIEAAPFNQTDGFSPGQPILTRVPGLDTPAALAQTDAVPLNALGRYAEAGAPVVLIDAATGSRQPIWVELDSRADTPEKTLLQIHPARPLVPGHRYVVALRDLKDAEGRTIPAQKPFADLLEAIARKRYPDTFKQLHTERLLATLAGAGVGTENLYLAWDFTVASDEALTGRMLSIRDRAFAALGDGDLADRTVSGNAPSFEITAVESPVDPRIARTVRGTVTVPCFLKPTCAPGGRFEFGPDGQVAGNGTYEAPFVCIVPHAAEAVPGRAAIYGHGLFHVKEEVEGLSHRRISNDHDIVQCATDQIGMSQQDLANVFTGILPDLSRFPELADRLQQGILNELFLGRLMIHPAGLASDPAFRAGQSPANAPVIDTSPTARLGYSGYSLGGILGGIFTAVSPDSDRGVLGVPGIRFSMLLPRSTQYDPFSALLSQNYTDPAERALILSLLQNLWDRGEPNGYAGHITGAPLPNTPPHRVLLLAAFGDHQVSNFSTDLLARATGALLREPMLDPGRWPGVDPAWDVPRIMGFTHSGSGLIYTDTGPLRPGADPGSTIGVGPPPLENLPNRSGIDPHSAPYGVAAIRAAVSDFLRPDGVVTNPCGDDPCYAAGWTGP